MNQIVTAETAIEKVIGNTLGQGCISVRQAESERYFYEMKLRLRTAMRKNGFANAIVMIFPTTIVVQWKNVRVKVR